MKLKSEPIIVEKSTLHSDKSICKKSELFNRNESTLSRYASATWKHMNPFVTGSVQRIKSAFTIKENGPIFNISSQSSNDVSLSTIDDLERIFKFLHKPHTKLAYLYHFLVIIVVVASSTLFNLLPVKVSYNEISIWYLDSRWHLILMSITNLIFCSWLTIEVIIRIWSAGYEPKYQNLSGRWAYLIDYYKYRIFDFFCILSSFGYLVFNFAIINFDPQWNITSKAARLYYHWLAIIDLIFRFTHLAHLLQIHRLTKNLVKPLLNTIDQQKNQLLFTIFLLIILMMICSMIIYIFEITFSKHSALQNEFACLWLTYETFSTLGYGDNLPYSTISIFILSLLSVLGVWVFALPSHIIGNGLSFALQDQRRITFKYVSTAKLIRTAITNQQITNRIQMYDTTQLRVKRRARLLTHHIRSVTQWNMLEKDALFKFDFQKLDEDDDENVEADQMLWNRLLMIGQNQPSISKKSELEYPKSKTSLLEQYEPSLLKSNLSSNSIRSRRDDLKKNSSDHMLTYLQNMDMSRYSGENSLLWYTLDLIESDVDEMNELVLDKLRNRFDYLKDVIENLVEWLRSDVQASNITILSPNKFSKQLNQINKK
ncbi:Potassium voltage-gated channel sub KQT member 4 [Blomia tropicalis]|nr:Potassium voltage-gated channel sub KQT member 4 [Blomia tropicalis]